MREYLISFFLFFCFLFSYSQAREEYYRSNYNGLKLLKIEKAQIPKYKFVVKDIIENELIVKRFLFDTEEEIKRWEFVFVDGKLREEKYYKEKKMVEKYVYDAIGHKINQIEFRNDEVSRNIIYEYNKNGLVNKEYINDIFMNRTNKVTYKYDSSFRIKQIIKEMYDGKIIYWDSFFTSKGIITKEYYSLNDERYVFYYNVNGQELKGEVFQIDEKKTETPKIYWENKYNENGNKIVKDEINYFFNKRMKTWFDNEAREIRVEIFKNDELQSIEEKKYDKESNVISQKEIKGLNVKENRYKYKNKDEIVRTDIFENGILKTTEIKNDDETRTLIVYGANNVKIKSIFDKDGNKTSEDVEFVE